MKLQTPFSPSGLNGVCLIMRWNPVRYDMRSNKSIQSDINNSNGKHNVAVVKQVFWRIFGHIFKFYKKVQKNLSFNMN